MEDQRRIRLAGQRLSCLKRRCDSFQRVYRAWHAHQPNKNVLPRAIDLMRRTEVRAVIEQDEGQNVTDAQFEAFKDNFTEWSTEWKNECDERLRELIQASPAFKDKLQAGVDPLSLASVVFTCRRCSITTSRPQHIRTPPLYPAILTHDCLYPRKRECLIDDPFERAAVCVSKVNMFGTHTFWSCDNLRLSTHWSERMEKIITMFNKDPRTATREEMDMVDDVRVCCFKCPMNTPFLQDVMNWRHTVSRPQRCALASF